MSRLFEYIIVLLLVAISNIQTAIVLLIILLIFVFIAHIVIKVMVAYEVFIDKNKREDRDE